MGLLTVVSLFSGCGGLDLAAQLAGGFRTVVYVEQDAYRQGILMSLMQQGALDTAPIHDDVTTFDATSLRGLVGVVVGGDPCQPHSVAGKRKGLEDDRWLWPHFRRIIAECLPHFVLRENVPGTISSGGLIAVLEDLEGMGYRASPYKISAAEVGAWHLRQRIFVLAHLDQERTCEQVEGPGGEVSSAHLRDHQVQVFPDHPAIRRDSWKEQGCEVQRRPPQDWNGSPYDADAYSLRRLQQKGGKQDLWRRLSDGAWWDVEPGVGRVVHGCPARVERIEALGDVVVPQQAIPFFRAIAETA